MQAKFRQCIVCREYKHKSVLDRYTNDNGTIKLDNGLLKEGRSSYTCREGDCKARVNDKILRKRLKIK